MGAWKKEQLASVSPHLVWELVKNHNAFLRKGLNHTVFSAEKGNPLNKHGYKHSGLANLHNTVHVEAAADGKGVVLSKSVKRHGPQTRLFTKTDIKKNDRRTVYAVSQEAKSNRKDLAGPLRARASAVTKSLRVKRAKAASN